MGTFWCCDFGCSNVQVCILVICCSCFPLPLLLNYYLFPFPFASTLFSFPFPSTLSSLFSITSISKLWSIRSRGATLSTLTHFFVVGLPWLAPPTAPTETSTFIASPASAFFLGSTLHVFHDTVRLIRPSLVSLPLPLPFPTFATNLLGRGSSSISPESWQFLSLWREHAFGLGGGESASIS